MIQEFFEDFEHEFNFSFLQKNNDEWVFRCPICGDSQHDETITNGHFKMDWCNNNGFYKCFRSGKGYNTHEFIKEGFPHLLSDYRRFKYKHKVNDVEVLDEVEDDHTSFKHIKKEIPNVFEFKTIDELGFKKIEPHQNNILNYLLNRNLEPNNFLYDPKTDRIVVPYFNKEFDIYYYQLRSIKKDEKIKYIFDSKRNVNKENLHRNIFGIYHVDNEKPVTMLEGAIDSLFVENAIGNSGIGNIEANIKYIIDNFGIRIDNIFLLLDFDVAGFEHLIKLSYDYYVFDWIQYLEDNDLTNYISSLSKLDINQLGMDIEKSDKFTHDDFKKYYVKYSRGLERKYNKLIRSFLAKINKDRDRFKE